MSRASGRVPALRHACAAIAACVMLAACDEDEPVTTQADAAAIAGESRPIRLEYLTLPETHHYATDFAFLPGTDELLLLQKDGLVTHYRLGDGELEPLGEMRITELRDDSDCGLISLAVDRDYDENGFVYFGLCTTSRESGVFRYRFDPADYAASAASRTPVLLAHEPDANRAWHNIGALAMDDAGYLWAGFGDKTVSRNASDPTSVLGSVVRIDPSRDPDGDGYEPPPDNPFVQGGGDPAVFAYGVRSPWRLAVDARGRAWFGDVGLDGFEEINVASAPGENFGWPQSEGRCRDDCRGVSDPTVLWSHSDEHPYVLDDPDAEPTTLRVAFVGLSYRPDGEDRYDGWFSDGMLFGDSCLGNLRLAELSDDGELLRDEPRRHVGRGIVSMRQGRDDYIYGLSMGECVTNGDSPPTASFFRIVVED